MFALWLRACPTIGPLRLATRAFGVTPQARELLQEEKASLCSNRTWFGYRIKHPQCYGYVYLWYDRKQRKLCIGSHHKPSCSASVWDGYLTSTGHCKKEIGERPYDFRFRVLEYNVENNCQKRTQTLEQKWLDKILEGQLEGQPNTRYYNQCRLAGGGFSMDATVAAKISAANKKAVANGTHNFIHSHPMKDAATKERMKATVARAVANGTHNFIHSNPMRDPAIKEKIIEKMKIAVAKAVANGTHHFVHSNPMKNLATKERANEKRKITVAKAVADGTHNFIHSHPSKNPIAQEKRKATVAKAVANGTHHFVHSHPLKDPAAKAKRKATFEKKKNDANR
eukprot:GEMP01022449.1.p1 GENE.GEMP01022449.1~~GEMP01022449.1.p1  ORF type:complete len:340 (+),score=42.67 GEMP01022449.1:108-1127(+)